MIKYSSQPPFCVSYPPRISNDIVVPIHVYHAYDAVMIYAQALTEALREGYDPRNGTNVMERIRNRRYRSVLGFDVSQTLSFHIRWISRCSKVFCFVFFLPKGIYWLERRRWRELHGPFHVAFSRKRFNIAWSDALRHATCWVFPAQHQHLFSEQFSREFPLFSKIK